MSCLSRIVKKQHRILKSLETTALIVLTGFDLEKIIVFPELRYTQEAATKYGEIYQNEIDAGEYKDIKAFDAIHTSDIEFSLFYHGKFKRKYNKLTKLQLIRLGNKWRERISVEHPDATIWIVVHYDHEDGWFLDTFNWDVTKNWDTPQKHTVWL
ncbi:hypothetical protein [uncultured Desulfobacter sp.]|uniref:hypothetical protein n=1 Tax=uncultured Desulfobacter sp. TaxID=240139 RepID=UPI0029F59615|nr:hypothetical protein [uncultured Desulfobacter sp.]